MKLIRQYISEENIQPIIEEKDNKKSYYIEGVFMQGDADNRNKRRYPTEILEKSIMEYKKDFIDKKRAFGELNHPNGPQINLDRVSHLITEIRRDGTNFVGRAKIMDTPTGNIVKSFIDEGALLGVSSRGLGSVKETKSGISEVQNDFRLSTVDIVADPSAPDAFVDGIMENYDWYIENGVYKAHEVEKIQEEVRKTPSRELQQKKLELFERFISNL